MDDPIVDVTVTAPSSEWLAAVTRSLIDRRLIACGNIIPAVRSIYTWDGSVHDTSEALVIMHTRASLAERVIAAVRAEHPYVTPRITAAPVIAVNDDYRKWVLDSTRSN